MATSDSRKDELKAKLVERDSIIRESWVRSMEARIVRDELEKCQRSEGVNHYESCKWLADKYLDKLAQARVSGYKYIETSK
ncbi:hypothetical protein FISHEDRAFT_77717 [Fistulina hepatica ATCC 64428]|nr:hypothetical protein FISHEDRAFT_77717 [Fistulina hepatica ATCC 64428]